ncbi:hypothetical protein [Pseudoalteromonas rhizosphaerae]|uniref:Uncharacterized protein n=1 Tax=Pseudoalteromonas rhizosphaerae TaxID=2518973 RepID=A0ABW8KZF7_9GAMM
MSIFKQQIEAGATNELNKAGQHVKVINAAASLQLRVFRSDGFLMLDSEVRSGFELMLPQFGKVTVTSGVAQEYEIWCSGDKLGYDAPSANANNLTSYKALHFGDTDSILPFEPNRLTAKIVSDQPWFYGGANVDKENGIPVAAGEIAEIRGAANISAAIGAKGEYLPVNQAVSLGQKKLMYDVIENEHGIFAINNDSQLVKVDLGGVKPLEGVPNGNIKDVCNAGGDSIAFIRHFENYIYKLNLRTGKITYISVPHDSTQASQPHTRLSRISYQDGVFICLGNGIDKETNKSHSSIVIYDGENWTHKMKKLDYTATQFSQIFPASNNKVIVYSNGFYVLDIGSLPEIEDLSEREKITIAMGGLDAYMQCSENEEYYQFISMGVNAECVLINKSDFSPVRLGNCDAAVISNAGVVMLKDGKFKITKDLGNTYTFVDAPHDIADSSRTFYAYHKGVLFCLSSAFLGYYVTEKQRIESKQTFRVLKAFS